MSACLCCGAHECTSPDCARLLASPSAASALRYWAGIPSLPPGPTPQPSPKGV